LLSSLEEGVFFTLYGKVPTMRRIRKNQDGMVTTTFQISRKDLDDLREKCSEIGHSMVDVIRVVVHDALQAKNVALHQRVVDFYRRQKTEARVTETSGMVYRFFCENEKCRRRSNVTPSDQRVVKTVTNQDGSIRQYIVTCPHCGVRQAVAVWRL
jgi:hypothetical protein